MQTMAEGIFDRWEDPHRCWAGMMNIHNVLRGGDDGNDRFFVTLVPFLTGFVLLVVAFSWWFMKRVLMATDGESTPRMSFQVIPGQGTETIRLLEKKEFRRTNWLLRMFHSIQTSRENNNNYNPYSKSETKTYSQVQQLVDKIPPTQDVVNKICEALTRLEKEKHFTYTDTLFALANQSLTSSSLAYAYPKEHTMGLLFQDLISKLVTSSAAFLKQVGHREEANLLSPRAHYRALTNYWVYLLVQWVFSYPNNQSSNDTEDTPPSVNQAAYSYSFLYPYTDDIMDDDESDEYCKKTLVSNIFKKIEMDADTNIDIPEDEYAFPDSEEGKEKHNKEKRLYGLLDQVLSVAEQQPLVQSRPLDCIKDSLRSINAAQLASLKQKRPGCSDLRACVLALSKEQKKEIFDIAVRKGAASCFPNAYLHRPDGITHQEAELVGIIGYMGQFINDIEGLFDDLKEKSLTPALISYLKHNSLDRFVERCLTHMRSLTKLAPQRFSTLPLDRVLVLFGVMQMRLLATTALVHENNNGRVLFDDCVKGIENLLKINTKDLAMLARTEQEVFGGVPELEGDTSKSHHPHHLSSPEQFRSFLLHKVEELRKEWKENSENRLDLSTIIKMAAECGEILSIASDQ